MSDSSGVGWAADGLWSAWNRRPLLGAIGVPPTGRAQPCRQRCPTRCHVSARGGKERGRKTKRGSTGRLSCGTQLSPTPRRKSSPSLALPDPAAPPHPARSQLPCLHPPIRTPAFRRFSSGASYPVTSRRSIPEGCLRSGMCLQICSRGAGGRFPPAWERWVQAR